MGKRSTVTAREANQHSPPEKATNGDGDAKAGGDATSGERDGGGREKDKRGRERSGEAGNLGAETGDGGTPKRKRGV